MPRIHRSSLSAILAASLFACDQPLEPSTPSIDGARSPSDCRVPSGIPFRRAPGVSAAGYGLNTNDDGIQNYGELAVDCGGAGDTFCADTVDLDVVVEATYELPPVAGFAIQGTRGTINGRAFTTVQVVPGQGFAYEHVGVVFEGPTRRGSQHGPPNAYAFDALIPGTEHGAIAIAMDGVTGGHPYAFSAQEAVLASRYLREHLRVETVVVTGPSYGGAAAQVDATLHPAHFDGVVSIASPYDGRAFVAWSELSALRSMGANLPVIDPLYYPGLDGMTMAAAQIGLSVENADVTLPQNPRVLSRVFLGEVDLVWLPGARVEHDRQRMASQGIDTVDVLVAPEEGHGGVVINNGVIGASLPLFQTIERRREAGLLPTEPAECPSPRERSTDYDHVLRAAPVDQPHPAVIELWSEVFALEGGDGASGSVMEDGQLFAGSTQGYVSRRDVEDPGTVVWSTPVGRAVQAVAVHHGDVVAGSKRGLAVIDGATGLLIRETLDIGSVHDVVIADVIPEVPGLEIAARTDMDRLHVESLATGERLSSTTIGSGGSMIWSDVLGEPHLVAPLRAGHLAAFAFVEEGGAWVPEAQWLSAYQSHDIRVVRDVTVEGRSVLVSGGAGYGDTPSLVVDELNGTVRTLELMPQLNGVRSIVPWTKDAVLVAGRQAGTGVDAIYDVNLVTGSMTLFATDATTMARLGPDPSDGLAMWHKGAAAPSFRVVDAAGQESHATYGQVLSPAMHVRIDEDADVYELSVMDPTWEVRRFDLLDGFDLGALQLPSPLVANRAPRGLGRVEGEPEGYQPFLTDGAMLGNIRIAERCGSWVASTSLEQEQDALLVDTAPPGIAACATVEWGPRSPVAPPELLLTSEKLGERLALNEGGDIEVVFFDGDVHAVLASPGGQVARYAYESLAVSVEAIEPDVVVDTGGTHVSLAVTVDDDGSPWVATSSWFPDADGNTLHLMDGRTLTPRMAIDAGPALGVAMADVDRDGAFDMIVGDQNGFLTVYDQSGQQMLRWSAGDLALGENGALFAHTVGDETIVTAAVAGGWRVLSIQL